MPEPIPSELACRVSDPALADFLTVVLDLHKQNGEKIDALAKSNAAITQSNASMQNALDKILDGFPQGDPQGHRRYHEAVIAGIEWRNELLRAVLKKAAESGFLVGGGWVLYGLWLWLKTELNK